MNKRVIWLALAVGLILAGYFVNRRLGVVEPAASSLSRNARDWGPIPVELPPLPPVIVTLPEMVVKEVPVPPMPQPRGMQLPLEIPIQDGATIDFSIGAPVVRSGGADTEALERALKEMAEATKGTAFPPGPEPPPEPAK